LQAISLSDDGRLAASGSTDGTAKIWDAASGQVLHTLDGHAGPVYCVSLSRDGQLLASGGADQTVRLWETSGGRPLGTLRGHTGTVRSVAVSRDGLRVASGGYDGSARLWHAHTGECLRTFSIERRYERVDISGLTGITGAQHQSMVALGAVDRTMPT
jgi:WD40 repeat protein